MFSAIRRSARLMSFMAIPFLLLPLFAGCQGSDTPTASSASTNSVSVTATVGAGGGTVTHPDGVEVVIPPGALNGNTVIGIKSNPSGAPAPLQVGNAPAGPIYEFTPHGIVFNTPVTIRMPIQSGAVSSEVFMASLGGNWAVNSATPVGGFAEWPRNSFSFSLMAGGCVIPVGSTDPYPCSYPSGGATVTAAPSTAITQVSPGWNSGFMTGGAGTWSVNHSGTVTIRMEASAPLDCSDPRISLSRVNLAVPPHDPNRRQLLLNNELLAMNRVTVPVGGGLIGSGGTVERLVGSRDYDVSAHLTDPTNSFIYSFSCRRPAPYWTGRAYGEDHITIIGTMAPPAGPFTIGGTITGLTGTGLELQNNGGDNLSPSGNGQFTFRTSIPTGATYNVTVLTHPSGQTCSVQNDSGTATAHVSNVAVVCASSQPGLVLAVNSSDGRLSIYRRDAGTGALTPSVPAILQTGFTAGSLPTSIVVRPNGQSAYVTNQFEFSVAAYSIDTSSGVVASLGPPLAVQPYPYGIAMDPLGRFLWITSWQGSSNSVRAYVLDQNGRLNSPATLVANHVALAAHPSGHYVYGVDESSNTISGYSVNQSTGALTSLGSAVSTGANSTPFRLAITPDGRFAYTANQFDNGSISIFSINTGTGALTPAGSVSTTSSPYAIVIHPSGRFLYVAQANDDRVSIYSIDSSNGSLTATAQGSVSTGSSTGPYGLTITSTGDFLYTANGNDNSVSSFSIDSGTGDLSPLAGSPVPASAGPTAIAVTP